MNERSYRLLLWTVALAGVAVDQASKYGVFALLHDVKHQDYALFDASPASADMDIDTRDREFRGFRLMARFDGDSPHVNQGALWGIFRDHKELANAAFATISLLAAAAIIYWSGQKATARDPWLCASLGLILAGTLGNFYDRVVFHGVRDFLHWNYIFDWPVFNFADCCLVFGAALLLLQAFSPQAKPAPVVADLAASKT